jgi:hypothetical protein
MKRTTHAIELTAPVSATRSCAVADRAFVGTWQGSLFGTTTKRPMNATARQPQVLLT